MKLAALLLTLATLCANTTLAALFDGTVVRDTTSQSGQNSYSEVWYTQEGMAYQLGNYSAPTGAQTTPVFQNTPRVLGTWSYSENAGDPLKGTLSVRNIGGTQTTMILPLRYDLTPAGTPDTRRINIEGTGLSTPYLFRHDGTPAARRMNTSSRIWMRPRDTSTFGFIVDHESRYYLIRALGASVYHVGTTLGTPSFKLFNTQGRQLARGSSWNASADSETIFTALFDLVYAARLREQSMEEVLVIRLDPGCYTVEVSNPKNETGDAMIEVFALPFTIPETKAQ